MKNFILSATVLAFAGLSVSQAGTLNNSYALSVQDTTTKEEPAPAPQDTSKKEGSLAYTYAVEQDTTKKEEPKEEPTPAPQDTTKKEAGLTNEYAVEQDSTTAQQAAPAAAEERAEVKLGDLPDPVKTTLSADIFKEWVPTTSYHVKEENKEFYHIEVKKGEEFRSIKINPDGKVAE